MKNFQAKMFNKKLLIRKIIIEYKKSRSLSFHGLSGHYVPKETIIREMKEAGYVLKKELIFYLNSILQFIQRI